MGSPIRTACSPATTRGSATTTARPGTTSWVADGFVQQDMTLQHPRTRLGAAEGPRRAIYARTRRAHLRYAEGQVPERLRDDRGDVGARQGDDVDVCARLDAAFQGRAEHPRHGDAAAPARQYRRGGRRHERAARSFQHPGSDRPRPDVEPDPRVSHDPDREGEDVRRLHGHAAVQAAAAGPDQLLAQLRQVLRLLPEGDVGRRRRPRTTTGATTTCPSSTCRPTTSCACSS